MFGEAYPGQIAFAEVVALVETPEGQIARRVLIAQTRVFDFEADRRQTAWIAQPKAREYQEFGQ